MSNFKSVENVPSSNVVEFKFELRHIPIVCSRSCHFRTENPEIFWGGLTPAPFLDLTLFIHLYLSWNYAYECTAPR